MVKAQEEPTGALGLVAQGVVQHIVMQAQPVEELGVVDNDEHGDRREPCELRLSWPPALFICADCEA